MTLRMKVMFEVLSVVSGTLTFSLNINGVSVLTSGTVTTVGNGKLEIDATIRGSSTLQTAMCLVVNGQTSKFTRAATASGWVLTALNTIDVVAIWSVTGNDVSVHQASVDDHYRT